MAKYTATIDEDTRQRIHALPRHIHFSAFMREAISVFVEELEKDPDLQPENFIPHERSEWGTMEICGGAKQSPHD